MVSEAERRCAVYEAVRVLTAKKSAPCEPVVRRSILRAH